MEILFRRRHFCWGIAWLALFLTHATAGQTLSRNEPARGTTTLVFLQGVPGLGMASSPGLVQHVADDLDDYLKANHVTFVVRSDDGSSGVSAPFYAVQDMAQALKAEYLLYVLVQRPVMKWLKVTVRCYDASGQKIWEEESSAGKELTGRQGQRNALRRLHQKLDRRVGQPGLLRAGSQGQGVSPAAAAMTGGHEPTVEHATLAGQPEGSEQAAATSGATGNDKELDPMVRLASGTPVRLILAESISSKTAKPGTSVKLQVMGDVMASDLVVIANKAPAVATIQTAEGAGRAWHAGHLLLKLDTVTLLDGKQQKLQAWNASKGPATGAAVEWTNAITQSYGIALFALPFAPLQHGNEAFLYKGTEVDAVTAGDVLLPKSAIVPAQPTPVQPRSGPASVTIYYPDLGHGSKLDIWCGQVKVGRLQRGGKLVLSLPPATYWFGFWCCGKHVAPTRLDAESGAEQFLSVVTDRVQVKPLEMSWMEQLSVVPHDVGELQSADAATAKSDHLLAADKMDLTQLQADPHQKRKK